MWNALIARKADLVGGALTDECRDARTSGTTELLDVRRDAVAHVVTFIGAAFDYVCNDTLTSYVEIVEPGSRTFIFRSELGDCFPVTKPITATTPLDRPRSLEIAP